MLSIQQIVAHSVTQEMRNSIAVWPDSTKNAWNFASDFDISTGGEVSSPVLVDGTQSQSWWFHSNINELHEYALSLRVLIAVYAIELQMLDKNHLRGKTKHLN